MVQVEETKDRRIIPKSDLELNMMITDTQWGSSTINSDLKERLTKYFAYADDNDKDSRGQPKMKVSSESMWGVLGYYTRDLRLANLSTARGEVAYCQYYLDLAGDLLQNNAIKPFLIALSRVATMLELSQSKGGFLRKRMNTLSQEHISQELEPKKKTLFGKGMEE